jgi:transcriptional regulator with XRE-family HTH domain
MRTRLSSQVGPAVRKLRLSKGLTLAQLSQRSGIPLSTLSKLELAQVALTYDKLARLCRALEVDIEETMQAQAHPASVAIGRRSVFRAGEGEAAASGPHRARFLGAELLDKSLSPVVLEVQAASLEAHGPLRELPGEACLVVLEGAAVLHSEIYAPLVLNAGDGVYFDGRGPHAILATEGGAARVLLVAAGEVA